MINPFVITVNPEIGKELISDLKEKGFSLTKPPHTIFSAKKPGLSCTLYLSGKLVIQGKETSDFVEFYLEPKVLKQFPHTHANYSPHIGIDEAGKGDFFGPLVIAGVFADDEKELKSLGVKDSKGMKDPLIHTIAKKIRAKFPYQIVRLYPKKYNELYLSFNNLNHLLAWGHATAIEALVEKTGCREVLIDQFAAEHVVEKALHKKKMEVNLVQRHRGEEDLVVAAASILARDAFVEGLKVLESQFAISLPKGAGPKVLMAGRAFLRTHGKEALPEVAKMHFKTLDSIC
ncbi:MAG: ribonuclease HIII [Waddliaceae bacterium]